MESILWIIEGVDLMRKRNIALIAASTSLLALAVFLFPNYGHTGGGGGFIGAKEITQLANNSELAGIYAKEVEQLAKQLEQIQLAVQQYENMVTMAKSLTDFDWINATGHLLGLQKVIDRAGSLYSSIGHFDEVFRKQYPGYRYKIPGYASLQDYSIAANQQFRRELESYVSRYDMTLSDFETTGKTLDTLQKRSATAEGRMQVLQVANDLAAQTANEIGKLRIAVAAQSSMIAQNEARRIQKEEDEQAQERSAKMRIFRPYENKNSSAVLNF